MISSIGLIGSGEVARALANHALGVGIPAYLSNSRGPASLADVVNRLGNGAHAVTVAEATEADLVIVAIPFLKVPELTGVVDWAGKLVVDARISSRSMNRPTPALSTWARRLEASGWRGICRVPE